MKLCHFFVKDFNIYTHIYKNNYWNEPRAVFQSGLFVSPGFQWVFKALLHLGTISPQIQRAGKDLHYSRGEGDKSPITFPQTGHKMMIRGRQWKGPPLKKKEFVMSF